MCAIVLDLCCAIAHTYPKHNERGNKVYYFDPNSDFTLSEIDQCASSIAGHVVPTGNGDYAITDNPDRFRDQKSHVIPFPGNRGQVNLTPDVA